MLKKAYENGLDDIWMINDEIELTGVIWQE